MKQKLIGLLFAVAILLSYPTMLLAQEEVEKVYDGRLEGYTDTLGSHTLDSRGTALLWLLLIVLTAVCVGVMFKNARRTHLD